MSKKAIIKVEVESKKTCLAIIYKEYNTQKPIINPKPKSVSRLQLVQNTTARLSTKSKRQDHISPVLASLPR